MKQLVMHVDMDAFFASVEQRDHEEWRGKPVIVGGLSARGVVSTASYEARKFGVHSALPMAIAKRRCPRGIFVPGNHKHYREVSMQIFRIFDRFSPKVEPLSIDEAFLDLTGMEHLMQSPEDYARRLKRQIKEDTGLVASIGIAPNKFLAKLASDLEKPDGLVIIPADRVQAILAPLPVRRLWGAGRKTTACLEKMGVVTIGDLVKVSLERLSRQIGAKPAAQLLRLAKGQDDRPVLPAREAKSIGREETFASDLRSYAEAESELLALSEQVGWRLRVAGVNARTLQLKIRLGDFTTYTRSQTLSEAVCYDDDIYLVVREMFRRFHVHTGIRLLGIAGSNFDAFSQPSLFVEDDKKQQLYQTIDKLRARFGPDIVGRAGSRKT